MQQLTVENVNMWGGHSRHVRSMTAKQGELLEFIRQSDPTERAIKKRFTTKGSDWLTLRNRIDSLIARGLVRNVAAPDATGSKYGRLKSVPKVDHR